MCGICGIVNFEVAKKIDSVELSRMATSIRHRGPDDEGFYISGNTGLGFRRLSIIDLKTGHQPLCNEDQSIWIVFNGEIYNFRELRDQLERKGHIFKSGSDTEAIVHLYEEYGEDCVQQLRGMFAFAIFDEKNRKLFCARDRFGIKPFYYYVDEHKFVFASELKSILQIKGVAATMDLRSLDSYLTSGYVVGDNTIYANIKKLAPAHTLTLTRKGRSNPTISQYWKIAFAPDYSKTEAQWAEQIETTLTDSVRSHLVSDVPLGAFLSGGIDSSSVVALMSKLSSSPVKTFSIGFTDPKYNELQFAREIAKRYGTEHHEQVVEPESIDLLKKLVAAYDQPFADYSAIPTYYVSKLARSHVSVVMSGDGGDELFAGYPDYAKMCRINRYSVTPKLFNQLVWGGINKALPQYMKGKGITYLLSKRSGTAPAYLGVWTQPERKCLYTDEVARELRHYASESYKENLINNSSSTEYLSTLQELDLRTYLVDDILTKVDIASMQHSLEVRVPILDHKFAELSFRIPSGLKLNQRRGKYIFKQAMTKYLPDSILKHKKQGFTVPLDVWFRGDLHEYVADRLLSPNSPYMDYFKKDYVASIIAMHNRGMRNFAPKIWSLLFFAEWLDQNKGIHT
jgi:asparagine synthase (glutamine-hydrolysing)